MPRWKWRSIELMKELQQQIGCSVLFISHHLGVIAELCDEMIVMYAGEVVEAASTREIFHNARHPYTRKLLACDPARPRTARARLPTIPGTLPDLRRRPAGLRLPGALRAGRCHMLDHAAGCRHRRGTCRALLAHRPLARHWSSRMTGEPLLSVSDLKVRFRIGGFMAALAGQPTEIEAVAGVSFRSGARPHLRSGWRVRLRQDHAGAGGQRVCRRSAAGSVRFEGRESAQTCRSAELEGR
jgi:oligopeptide/dipeptide ABC transporter ATP-binding protein